METKQQKWLPYLRLVLLCLVAAIIGINVYTWNASRLAGDPFPMPLGIGVSVVLSGSMEPSLSVGDLLIVTGQESYSVDDVVVYADGRSAVVHRIIAMDEETVTTKGDANNVEDAPFSKSRIRGKVVFVIPVIGYLVSIVKTPIGTVLLLALAIWMMNHSFGNEKPKEDARLSEIRAEIERLKAEQQNKD